MTISIYAIDRDNGDGRYHRRHSFTPLGAGCKTYPSGLTGLAAYQDTDGGLVATVAAPDGARLEAGADGGTRLVLADGTWLDADEALSAARSKPWHSFGLRLAD